MKNKIISLFITLAMLIAFVPTVLGAQGDVITSISATDGVVTIDGVGEKNEAVSIFLLNPQKTVAELNATKADTAEFKAIVNYTDVVYTDNSKLFRTTFEINNFDPDKKYVLYVKTESQKEESATIGTLNVYVDVNTTAAMANGTKEYPFATIESAKDYVKTLPKTNPINVIIAGGEYKIYKQINFTSADSGSKIAPITYMAEDGAEVVLSGSKALDVSKFTVVTEQNNAAVYNKLPDTAKGKVVEIDLAEQGIEACVADYMADHEGARRVVPMGVYLNDDQQQISQYPNEGALTLKEGSSNGATASNPTATPATVTINGIDAAKAATWADAKDLYIDGSLKYGWCSESAPATVNADGTFTLKTFTQYGVNCSSTTSPQNTRVVVKNLVEEIDVPGEWYVDADTMKMYYYAPYTLTEDDVFEITALEDSFIWLEYCTNMTFDGLTFEKGVAAPFKPSAQSDNFIIRGAISTPYGCADMNITNCTFEDLGGSGMFLHGINNTTIDSNKFNNLGWTGVEVYGKSTESPLISCGVVISNNHVSNYGSNNYHMNAPGIRMRRGYGIVAKNNTIHNGGIGGIMHEYAAHTIKNNEIYNVLNEATDAGAIYNGGSFIDYGTTIEGNYIHSVGGVRDEIPQNTEEIAGVYWDDGFSGGTLKNNIIDMSNDPYSYALMACGGTDHVVEGNTFANAARGASITQRAFTQNAAKYESDLYYTRYFYTYLDATDYSATVDYDGNGTVDGEDKKFAVKNIGKDGGPQWKSYVTGDTYGKIATTYTKFINKTFPTSKTTAVVNNKYYNITNNAGVYDGGNMISTNSGNDKITSFDITVSGVGSTLAVAPEEFELVYPANESDIMETTTYLKWQQSDYADEYEYAVYTDEDMTKPVEGASGTTENNYVQITGLETGKTYYWTVTAKSQSKVLDVNDVSAQAYSFTVSDYSFENARYEQSSQTIKIDAKNIGEGKTVMLVAAVKVGGELKAAAVQNNIAFTKGYDDTMILDTTDLADELTLAGATLELYVWESDMKPLTSKMPIAF